VSEKYTLASCGQLPIKATSQKLYIFLHHQVAGLKYECSNLVQ